MTTLRWDLMRHGHAEAGDREGDHGRRLSPHGAKAVHELGTKLGGKGWRPDRVVASPLRRAVETASQVLDGAGVTTPIERLDELEPERDPEDILAVLAARADEGAHWLVVGHHPVIGRLLELLTGQTEPFEPGHMVSVRFEGPPGRRTGRVVRI